jgi:indole-3-glycerol phosphate synthase
MSGEPGITLQQIVEQTRRDVEQRKRLRSVDHFKELIGELGRPRNFFAAVTKHHKGNHTSVIAEIKRKSPSVAAEHARSGGERGSADGWIRPEYARDDFDPTKVARQYHSAGAAAISCLTDEPFFGGRLEFIHRIKDAVPIPVLRKDFIIDPWQVWESRAAGADAILLIAECLSESELIDLMILARELQLTSLIEVHDMENLLRVRPHIGFPSRSYCLLGINNRDLRTMKTDLSHTLRLVDLVDDPSVLVSESGIRTPGDLQRLRAAGVNAVLVGESLMKEEDPGAALDRLLAQ